MAEKISINALNLQALLFSEGGPVLRTRICKLLDIDADALDVAVTELSQCMDGTAIVLVSSPEELAICVGGLCADFMNKIYTEESSAELGSASLETLSVILYRGQSSRAEIDYIRGINSSTTIRTLISRGLIQRVGNPRDGREYRYGPSVELLAHLGCRSANELPEYDIIKSELAKFEAGSTINHGNTADSMHNG